MGHSDDGSVGKIKAHDESVYYSGIYWNDYKTVRDEINKRVSGKPGEIWYEYFHKTQKRRVFDKALILNCGNGWVERLLYKKGFFKKAVGVDYSESLVKEAREKAKHEPLKYYTMDINTADFPEADFDLVVNHASGHHIAHIDKVFRAIAKSMTPTGVFVNFDYVGPHRNQYPLMQWLAAKRVNRLLPPHMRQDMRYPHLPTMLVNDPSEAVHSELVLETMNRYFDIVEHKRMGGSIAYLLLTHNENFQRASRADVEKWSKFIMAKDAEYLKRHPRSSMFDYWIALPKRQQHSKVELKRFSDIENQRELLSHQHGNLYYRLNWMQKRTIAKEERRLKSLARADKRKANKQRRDAGFIGDLKRGLNVLRNDGMIMSARKFLFSRSQRPSLQLARYLFIATVTFVSIALGSAILARLFELKFQKAVLLGGVGGTLVGGFTGYVMAFSHSFKTYLRPRFFSALALVLCFGFFSLGTASLAEGTNVSKTRGQAITYDEISILPNGYFYRTYGKYLINPEHPPLVKFIASKAFSTLDLKLPREFPPDVLMEDFAQYGWGKEFLFDSDNNTEQIILRARVSVLAANTVLLFVLFLSVAKAWSRRAGFISLLFITTSQFCLAHASLVTVDFMPALFSVLTLTWFTIWLQRFRSSQPTRWPAILSSLFLAGALLSKFSAILLLPTLLLITVLYGIIAKKDLKQRFMRYGVKTIGILALSLAIIVSFYTWHVRSMSGSEITAQLHKSYSTERLPNWGLNVLEKTTNFGIVGRGFTEFAHGILMVNNRIYKGAGGVYFMGHYYGNEGSGPWYFVVLYLTKLPLIYVAINLLMALGAIALVIKSRGRNILGKVGRYPLPVFITVYAAIFGIIAIGSTLQIGLRHIMPTIVGLMVVTAIGLDVVLTKLGRRFSRKLVVFACLTVSGLLIVNMLMSYPYYLSSYNLLAGGTKNGYKIAVDSNYDWGQDMKRLAKWQQDNGVNKIYADVFTNPFLPLSYYLGPNVERYNITTDQPLAPGSYLAVSATKYQTNVHRYTSGPQSYRQYDDDFIARVGTSIFVYKVPQN